MRLRFLVLAVLLPLSGVCFAQNADMPAADSSWLDFKQWGLLAIQDGGRRKPVDTFARETLIKITGRSTYKAGAKTWQAADFILSMLLDTHDWKTEPMILVSLGELKQRLGLPEQERRFSFAQLTALPELNALAGQAHALRKAEKPLSRLQSEVLSVTERLALFAHVMDGNAFLLAPAPEKTTAYEWGIKSMLFNRNLQLNADLFLMNITNYQQTTRVLDVYTSLPFQGDLAARSDDVYDAERLALAEAGSRAGRFRVKLVPLDDSTLDAGRWDPNQVIANARRATQDPHTIAYVGELDTGASAVSIPVLDQKGILQVSPADGLAGLTRKQGATRGEPEKYYPDPRRNFVRVAPPDNRQAAAIAAYMKELGVTRLYVVNDGGGYGVVGQRSAVVTASPTSLPPFMCGNVGSMLPTTS